MEITITKRDQLRFNIYNFYIIRRDTFAFGYFFMGLLGVAMVYIAIKNHYSYPYLIPALFVIISMFFRPFFLNYFSPDTTLVASLNKNTFSVEKDGMIYATDLNSGHLKNYRKYVIMQGENRQMFFFTKPQFEKILSERTI